MTERVALYRLFNENGRLLYVGITNNPSVRFVHHKMEKTWWTDVARREIEWFASRDDALKAEVRAIHQESPLWNVSKSLTRKQAKRTSWRTRMRPARKEGATPDSNLVMLTFVAGRWREEMARRDALREEVAAAIRAANADGVPQKDIAEVTGYTRQQIRRIVLAEPQDA